MLKRLLQVFAPSDSDDEASSEERIPLAAAVLMLEVAYADGEFRQEEKEVIGRLLEEHFQVAQEMQRELLELANRVREGSSDLHQFTKEINWAFSQQEKEQIIEAIWQLVYADGRLDSYEDALMRQLGPLIGLSHRQLIDAKLRVVNG